MSIGLDPEHGQAPSLEHETPVQLSRASGSLNGSSVDTDVPLSLAASGLGVRVIVKDASVVGLPVADVSMVLIHDRLVIIPIPAYLARETGFTVVDGYPEVLVAAGVRMTSPVTVDDRAVSADHAEGHHAEGHHAEGHHAEGHHADSANGSGEKRNGHAVFAEPHDPAGEHGDVAKAIPTTTLAPTTPRDERAVLDSAVLDSAVLDSAVLDSGDGGDSFDPDAPVAAAKRVEEVSAARRVETQSAASPLRNLPVGIPSHQAAPPAATDRSAGSPTHDGASVPSIAASATVEEIPQFEATDTGIAVRASNVVLVDRESMGTLLDDVSIDILTGEFLVIQGATAESGALLSVLAGLETPDAGTVWRNGVHLGSRTSDEVDRHCAISEGVLSSSLEPANGDTVLGYVERPLLLLGFSKSASRNRASAVLRRFGIVNGLELPICEVHGTERERIAIAHGMVGDPKVLWIDDPAGTLGPLTAALVVTLARTLHRQGRTVVATGDDPAMVETATRRLTLAAGRVVADERLTM